MNVQIDVTGYRNAGALTMPQAKVELHGSRTQHTASVFARIVQGGMRLEM